MFNSRSCKTTATPLRKVVLSLVDCEDLRVILSVLYIITEVIRYEKEQGTEQYKSLFESFAQDIRESIRGGVDVCKKSNCQLRFFLSVCSDAEWR